MTKWKKGSNVSEHLLAGLLTHVISRRVLHQPAAPPIGVHPLLLVFLSQIRAHTVLSKACAAGTKAGSGAKPVEWVRPQGQEAGLAAPVRGTLCFPGCMSRAGLQVPVPEPGPIPEALRLLQAQGQARGMSQDDQWQQSTVRWLQKETWLPSHQ